MTSEDMENLIQLYGDDIYRFYFHITGSREEADDLYQDTFVKAIQLRHRLDSGGNVKSYLMGISTNLWKNRLRKNKRRDEIVPEISYENSECMIGDSNDPLGDYVEKEMKELLYRAVSNLPEKQRVVVLLHYTIENLRIDGVSDTSETIKEYADRMHKKCIMVDISIEAKADSQSIDYSTEADGTLVYKFSFDNVEKTKKLKYTCNTLVDTSEGENDNSLIKDSFEFSLNDKSGDVDKVKYAADSDKVIDGTHLVLDDVDVEKSALGMKFIVNYHTVDPKVKEWSKWIESKDSDLLFYLLDDKGNVIDSKESSGIENTQGDGARAQKDVYSLQTLPDKLTFLVKDCMTKEKIGTVTVTRTKNN